MMARKYYPVTIILTKWSLISTNQKVQKGDLFYFRQVLGLYCTVHYTLYIYTHPTARSLPRKLCELKAGPKRNGEANETASRLYKLPKVSKRPLCI